MKQTYSLVWCNTCNTSVRYEGHKHSDEEIKNESKVNKVFWESVKENGGFETSEDNIFKNEKEILNAK